MKAYVFLAHHRDRGGAWRLDLARVGADPAPVTHLTAFDPS